MTKTHEGKIAIRFDLIALGVFVLPLFVAMPEWYLTLETVVASILIGILGMCVFSVSTVLANTKHVPPSVSFFTWQRAFGWCVHLILLVSMFIQGLDNLFAVYLIAVLAMNAVTYMWLKKTS